MRKERTNFVLHGTVRIDIQTIILLNEMNSSSFHTLNSLKPALSACYFAPHDCVWHHSFSHFVTIFSSSSLSTCFYFNIVNTAFNFVYFIFCTDWHKFKEIVYEFFCDSFWSLVFEIENKIDNSQNRNSKKQFTLKLKATNEIAMRQASNPCRIFH